MNETYYITKLKDFQKALTGHKLPRLTTIRDTPVKYIRAAEEYADYLFFDSTKTTLPEMPDLAESLYLQRLQLLEALSNHYAPIYALKSNNLLYTLDAFLDFRQKMSGLKSYGLPHYNFSENLFFEELTPYLTKVDENLAKVTTQQNAIYDELKRIIASTGLSFSDELEIIGIGSTSRGTNVPDLESLRNSDFDFVIRLLATDLPVVSQTILDCLLKENPEAVCKKNDTYRLRLLNVKIPSLTNLVDIDISFMTQKKEYLSTEAAVMERLDAMKMQDYEKYKLVLANIMYTKALFQSNAIYKPMRSLPEYAKSLGGLGGIGIENWLLQNGGSLIDSAKDFTIVAKDKDYLTFASVYPVMDFGKNHVFVSQDKFPYDNFVQKNMGPNGYKIMNKLLLDFLKKH